MSIILGALGGMGQALEQVGATNQKAQIAQDQATLESNLATQRAQTLEVFKNNLAINTSNQQRQAQQERIGTAQQGIVGSAINAKYAGSDAAVAAANAGQTDAPLTADQQAVIDQSKATDTASLMNDPKTRTQAAIQTGDISPTDAMKTSSSLEINQLKMESLLQRAEDKNATMKEIGDVKAEAMKYGYELRLQAAQERSANGKIDTATSRMLITSEDANIRASTSQLNMLARQMDNTSPTKGGKPNPDYLSLQSQADDLRKDISASKATKLSLFKSLNIVPPDDATPGAPSPAAPVAGPTTTPVRPPLTDFLK